MSGDAGYFIEGAFVKGPLAHFAPRYRLYIMKGSRRSRPGMLYYGSDRLQDEQVAVAIPATLCYDDIKISCN
jgi:hypothetical protein